MGCVFTWRADDADLTTAFTDALGGVGEAPYGELNLGGHVGDDPASVRSNRELVADSLGVSPDRLLFMNQVHGSTVVEVDGPWGERPVPDADALVTRTPGLALGVLVADCTPVLVHDVAAGVVGVAHAGRPGLVAGVVPALVAAMRDLGATAPVAVVGPSICGRCYEVPAAMRDDVAAVAPEAAARTWTGTPAVDVAAGVVGQLAQLGVPLTWVPGCTRESPALYSYRREARTGRFAGVVVRRDAA